MVAGLTTAKRGVVAGGQAAYAAAGQGVDYVGSSTLETMDWTAERMKHGAGRLAEASYSTGAALRDKMDETGVSDRASQAAASARAAGGTVYASGAAGVSFVSQKIDENETLAGMKSTASAGASQAAAAASAAAATAVSSVSSWFGWGASSNSQSAAQAQAAQPQEESKGEEIEEEV